MNKNFSGKSTKANEVTAEDLALINKQTTKELTAEDVFTFSVVLCDNEVDRDMEQFTPETLKEIAPMFVGKPAIKNHNWEADEQVARTYKAEVFEDEAKKNSLGEPYVYLKASAYIPRIESNEKIIAEIESGIKKEVSVGMTVKRKICSICGETKCLHIGGKRYGEQLCYKKLDGAKDVYEWSFVAVPAQPAAGVTKSLSDKLKSEAEEGVTLTAPEVEELRKEFERLRALAEKGEKYLEFLKKQFKSAKELEPFADDLKEAMCEGLTIEILEKALEDLAPAEEPKEPEETPKETEKNLIQTGFLNFLNK